MTTQTLKINVPSITLIINVNDGTEMGRIFIIHHQSDIPAMDDYLIISDDERGKLYHVQVRRRLWQYSTNEDTSTSVQLWCKEVEK